MRDHMTPDVVAAIGAPVITTAYLARLEFKSETIFVWTGNDSIMPQGSGDSLLDNNVFDPLAYGVVIDIGENSFSYNGSDQLEIKMNIPAQPDHAIAAASVFPNEFQARAATIWRGLMVPNINPLAAPVWMFRRIRAGLMDKLEIMNDGQAHTFALTVESHQALITNASNTTYLDQRRYDPNDSSQDYAVSIANGDPAPVASNGLANYAGGIRDIDFGRATRLV